MRDILLTVMFLTGFMTVFAYEPSDSVVSIPELTVIGSRHINDPMKSAASISVISGDEIKGMHPQTSADLFSGSGMLSVQKSQQGGGSPMIRGFESSRILLMLDGVRMNNLIFRGGHLQNIITIDPNMLAMAEVLYGPASVAYGSDALGGVIVLSTPDPQTSAQGINFFGNAFMQFNGVNTGSTLHADFNIGGEKVASYTSVTYNRFGDLRSGRARNPFMHSDDGYINRPWYVSHQNGKDQLVDNPRTHLQIGSGYSQYDVATKLLFRPNDKVAHLWNLQFSNSGDIPRYDRLTDRKGEGPKFAEWYYGPQTRIMGSYKFLTENLLGADNASLIVAWQNLKESRNNRKLNDPWLGTRAENVNVFTINTDWVKFIGAHRLHAGIDGAFQWLTSTAHRTDIDTGEVQALDTRYPDGGNHMHNIDIFFSHTWEIDTRWTLTDGVRIGYSWLQSKFKSTEFFPFLAKDFGTVKQNNPTYSLSVGMVCRPKNDWKLGLNVATGYRVPNIDDIGKVFDSEPGMVVVPNPHIKPEKTISADFNVATVKNNRLEWTASLFATYLFDAIALAPSKVNGSDQMIYDGELSDIYSNRNNRLAYILGANTALQYAFTRNFSADAAVTYTYGNILGRHGEKDEPLDHIAPLFGRVGLIFKSNSRKIQAELFSLFNGRKPLSRYNLNGEDNIGYATVLGLDGQGLPAWFTLNLSASWSPSRFVTIYGGIDNILDTQYRVFASGINAPGRNFYAAIRVTF